MLKACCGSISTQADFDPFGASQLSNDLLAEPSSAIRAVVSLGDTASSAAEAASSTNTIFDPLSRIIRARPSAVDDGASGDTATPARKPPTNVARYSTEEGAQTAMTSPDFTPSRCRLAATRSTKASNSA